MKTNSEKDGLKPTLGLLGVGTLIVYIGQLFNPTFANNPVSQILLCAVFAGLVGFVAFLG